MWVPTSNPWGIPHPQDLTCSFLGDAQVREVAVSAYSPPPGALGPVPVGTELLVVFDPCSQGVTWQGQVSQTVTQGQGRRCLELHLLTVTHGHSL